MSALQISELVQHIFSYCDNHELASLSRVCDLFHRIAHQSLYTDLFIKWTPLVHYFIRRSIKDNPSLFHQTKRVRIISQFQSCTCDYPIGEHMKLFTNSGGPRWIWPSYTRSPRQLLAEEAVPGDLESMVTHDWFNIWAHTDLSKPNELGKLAYAKAFKAIRQGELMRTWYNQHVKTLLWFLTELVNLRAMTIEVDVDDSSVFSEIQVENYQLYRGAFTHLEHAVYLNFDCAASGLLASLDHTPPLKRLGVDARYLRRIPQHILGRVTEYDLFHDDLTPGDIPDDQPLDFTPLTSLETIRFDSSFMTEYRDTKLHFPTALRAIFKFSSCCLGDDGRNDRMFDFLDSHPQLKILHTQVQMRKGENTLTTTRFLAQIKQIVGNSKVEEWEAVLVDWESCEDADSFRVFLKDNFVDCSFSCFPDGRHICTTVWKR